MAHRISIILSCILLLSGCELENESTDSKLPLEQQNWSLKSYGFQMGEKNNLVSGSNYTLVFDGASRVSGSFDCNSFFSKYTADEVRLSIEGMVITRAFCSHADNETFQSQHETIRDALMTIQTYSISGYELTINSTDSTQLIYTETE